MTTQAQIPSPHIRTFNSALKSALSSGCRRDKDGYYWITGRIDDMLNVSGRVPPAAVDWEHLWENDPWCLSGHLMSTAEVEAALTVHVAVAEAAVVSRPHQVKGECLYCFVTLKNNREFSQTLAEELKKLGKAWMN